jgi:hypothetical protein
MTMDEVLVVVAVVVAVAVGQLLVHVRSAVEVVEGVERQWTALTRTD